MAKNSFDRLQSSSWVFSGLIYSCIACLFTFFEFIDFPRFALVFEASNLLVLFLCFKKKPKGEYRIIFAFSLLLNALCCLLLGLIILTGY